MHKLTGYGNRWGARAGGRIGFHVSSDADRSFDLRFVRIACADPNPEGPGYRETAMPTPIDGMHPGRFHDTRRGSHIRVQQVVLPAGGLLLHATIWPTAPGAGQQVALAMDAPGLALRLGIGAGGGARAEVNGTSAEVATGLAERRWYRIEALFTPGGRLHVRQIALAPAGPRPESGSAETACPAFAAPSAAVMIAAAPQADGFGACFNGKIEAPGIAGTDGGVVARWDFSRDMASQRAVDAGPQGAHGTIVNLASRAMTGSNWTGAFHDWRLAPDQYGAIHFHDDDLGDCGWPETFALDIPAEWPGGLYAAHLKNADGEDMIPFYIRPAQPRADVAVLIPTFSYQVYSSFVRPGRGAENLARALEWGALPETPDMNPQFGLSIYNYHSDGSGVSITSMLRPQLDTRPRQISLVDPVPGASGTSRVCADSYVLDWLDHAGVAHDVLTDHDLHDEGIDALAPYRVLICCQHPEYWSMAMMEALEAFIGRGGRVMYLGGNGFYWRAEPVPGAPHALEVRRAEGGIRTWEAMPGEYHHPGGGLGGLWRRVGKPAHRLVGNGFSAQGRHLGFPYRWTDSIHDPRVAFMTEGLETPPGGVFGDTGFMGGGAAGFELDSADIARGTPPHALVVAKGVVIHDDYAWVNEDMLTHRHPRPREDWSCADLTFFETPAGGAVFSVGSMTWVGSLPPEDYANPLARLCTNVVRRFCDPTPFT